MNLFLRNFFRDWLQAYFSLRVLYTRIHAGQPSASWLMMLIYCLIYVGGTIWLAATHTLPFEEPMLKIDPERYYFVQTFYEGPLMFAVWIMAAGILHLVGRFFGGQSRYETMLVMCGWSIFTPWALLIPFDLIAGEGWLYNLALTALSLLMIGGTTVAVKIEAQIGWPGAVVTALAAILPVGLLLGVLIR